MNTENGGKHQNDAASFTLSREEVERLFAAAASTRDDLILRTLYFTAVRREELTAINVEDVDLDRRRVYIRNGKGGKSRMVPLTADLTNRLRKHIGRRRKGPLFLSNRNAALSVRSVNHIVATTGERAGLTNPNPRLQHINPHLLRHSFVRHYLSAGGDLRKVSQIIGHANVAITHAVYGTASEEEIADEYETLMGSAGITIREVRQ